VGTVAAATLAAVRSHLRETRARRIRDLLGPPTAANRIAERSVVVTIEGALAGDETASRVTTFFPYGVSLIEEPTAHAESIARPKHLAIGDVVIEGPVQIVLGSSETTQRANAVGLRALGVASLAREGMLRSVEHGETVLARGKIESIAGETARGYRQ